MNNELIDNEDEVIVTRKRTDIHRPSFIIPTDYEYVAFEYIKLGGSGDIMADCSFLQACRATITAHMARTGGTYSHHQHGGNCHVCGASAIYTVLFYHAQTNSYIRTGQDCAEKMDMSVGGDWNLFRNAMKAANQLKAGKRKAIDTLESKGLLAAWSVYTSVYGTQAEVKVTYFDLPKEERIVADMVGNLIKFGSFASIKQENFLGSLLNTIARRAETEARWKAEYDAAASLPLMAGRNTIEGTVQSVKMKDTRFGDMLKMVVRDDSGWKVYGTVPRSLKTKRGDRVRFDAVVTLSPNDPKFGFFSNPTKAEVLVGA